MVALLSRAHERGADVTVPASVLAQVIRDPARQVRLSRLVRQPTTRVVALDRAAAIEVGRLLAASGTADVVDAHVVACGRRSGTPVVTSDPDDLTRIDPSLPLVRL